MAPPIHITNSSHIKQKFYPDSYLWELGSMINLLFREHYFPQNSLIAQSSNSAQKGGVF